MYKAYKVLMAAAFILTGMNVSAQDKIDYPEITYAGNPSVYTIGGINVTPMEGYEDFVLASISGLSVGQRIEIPGSDITEAVKKYWKYQLFS
ncbi:MAG: outer membrane protein assembly factor BamA, partial [Prevotella sp.]|nr:outer membrane protein assembly factor BamA [Prevotella sp.]